MAWTDEMVEDLKKMWHEGLTTGEIGKRLNVSKNSIVGKVHRLGLSGRPSPIKKKENSENSVKPAPVKEKEAKPVKEEKAPVKVKAEKTEKIEEHVKEERVKTAQEEKDEKIATAKGEARFEAYKQGKTMLTDLDNHTCRWPIGDPKDENFHFCGKKVKIGQTYCEEHSGIAYVKTGKK